MGLGFTSGELLDVRIGKWKIKLITREGHQTKELEFETE